MKYFSIRELTASATAKRLGIDNTPDKRTEENLVELAETVLDPLREAYGKPIVVTSGYRCPRLNKAVGGSLLGASVYFRSKWLEFNTQAKQDIRRDIEEEVHRVMDAKEN